MKSVPGRPGERYSASNGSKGEVVGGAAGNSADPPAAFAWMAASAALFATMNFFVRLASSEVPWQLVGASRALIGGLVAVLVARLRGSSLAIGNSRVMWPRSVLGTLSMIATFWALGSGGLGLGDTTTLLNLSPVAIAVLGPWLLGERVGRALPMALAMSLAGVVLVVRPALVFGGATLHAGATKTAALAILAACFSAGAMIALRRVGQGESPEAISAHFSFTAAGTFAVLSLPVLAAPSARASLHAVLAGVAAGVAQLAMTRAYALARASRVAPLGYFAVVVSALYGTFALGEAMRATTIAGMALVIAGGVLVVLPGFRAQRAAGSTTLPGS